jgi:hypothetical protein
VTARRRALEARLADALADLRHADEHGLTLWRRLNTAQTARDKARADAADWKNIAAAQLRRTADLHTELRVRDELHAIDVDLLTLERGQR